MFEKTLHDLVKGLRNQKGDTTAYVAKCIQEIKDELKSRDVLIKTQALQKLLYLHMLGHDMSWAAFHVIEVMSQERYGLKRIGFQAAAESFTAATDVIVLCTQLLKKEFQAKSAYEIGTAINCLANIATEDLSRDLISDVTTMMTSSRAYIRKKATLVLYRMYTQYPAGLRLTFDNLKRRLTDESPSVQSCAVNVICELARKKPSNYLSIAPELFTLLTSSSNNWMLIKITKLMSSLVQEEPRLARKLLEPLANVVQTTPAKSLMYESISAITFALQYTKRPDGTDAKNAPAVVRLCTDKLREMVREPDQNLKYLGLVGLTSLMRSHPRVVAEHRELVLQCLLDEDETIRIRALELITGMVTRRNLPDIVKRLLELLEGADGHWRDELIDKIVFICSRDKYAFLVDFAWYISVLAKLAYVQGSRHYAIVAGQLIDVSVRVEEVRPFSVQTLLPMLADPALANQARMAAGPAAATTQRTGAGATPLDSSTVEGSAAVLSSAGNLGAAHVLYAAAWIVGEYCAVIPRAMFSPLLDALVLPTVAALPPPVQAVYVQTALKILAAASSAAVAAGEPNDSRSSFVPLASSVLQRLHPFAQSIFVEVQERACLAQQLLATLGVPFTPLATPTSVAAAKAKAEEDLMNLAAAPAAAGGSPSKGSAAPLEVDMRVMSTVLASLFSEPLKPVNAKAQKKVAVPTGLDLDKWIHPEAERSLVQEEDTRRGTSSIGFKFENITFEDSYIVTDEEFAGNGRRESAGYAAAASLAGDDDDNAWFEGLVKDKKKRDKELWGEGASSPRTTKKEAAAKESKRARERKTDPYMLRAASSSAAREVDDMDVDSIPLEKLPAGELRSALDATIFGDFGAKAKAGAKAGKKGKGKKKAAADDDDDEEEAAPRRAYAVAADDDMPEGAAASDDDEVNKTADALSSVDLSTPLRPDEQLPHHAHRTVADPAAGATTAGRGRGRARVLGASADAAPAAEEGGKKKGKKKDAEAAAEKPKKSKKKDAEEAPAEEKPKKKKAAAEASAAPAAPTVKQGEEYAAAPAYTFTLGGDKVVRITYTVSLASSAPVAEGAPVPVVVNFVVEPRSLKKTVDYVDLALPAGAPVAPGAAAGASADSLRLAASLKEREKGKNRSKKAALTFGLANVTHTLAIPARIVYLVTGASAPVTLDVVLPLRSASVLVPTVMEADAYKSLMTGEGAAAFTHANVALPVADATAAEATINSVAAVLRSFAVGKSAKHAILYARTVTGAHVTALAKLEESASGSSVSVTIKSVLPGHAAVLAEELHSTLAAAAAAAKDE